MPSVYVGHDPQIEKDYAGSTGSVIARAPESSQLSDGPTAQQQQDEALSRYMSRRPSNPDGPQQSDLPPPPDDPMRPGIDLMERQLSEAIRKHGTGTRRKQKQAQSEESTPPAPED